MLSCTRDPQQVSYPALLNYQDNMHGRRFVPFVCLGYFKSFRYPFHDILTKTFWRMARWRAPARRRSKRLTHWSSHRMKTWSLRYRTVCLFYQNKNHLAFNNKCPLLSIMLYCIPFSKVPKSFSRPTCMPNF